MKKTLLIAFAACAFMNAAASDVKVNPSDVEVYNLDVQRTSSEALVSFGMDASNLKLKSNQEVTLTPRLVSADNRMSADLPSVTVAGRNRYYYHMRNDGDAFREGINIFRNGSEASDMNWQVALPFQEWMTQSKLVIDVKPYSCCGKALPEVAAVPVATFDMQPPVYECEYVFVVPEAEKVKVRQESGSAYVEFPVGKSVINPDFRNNQAELAKIRKTIEAVQADKDLTITSVTIKGYASPEGSQVTNDRLAQARTDALLAYVKGLYKFPASVKLKSISGGENWEGLKAYVESSDMTEKAGILAIINNSSLTDDQKDEMIKKTYPTDYNFLLKNVYPTLRRTDYTVGYSVREYADAGEIIAVLKKTPQKLSLNEIFIATEKMTPGTPEYAEAFETAVLMYPDSEVANLNAANTAMSAGDYKRAAKYLQKAGTTPQADYARGVLSALQKDWETAASYFAKVQQLPQAVSALQQVRNMMANPTGAVVINNYNGGKR